MVAVAVVVGVAVAVAVGVTVGVAVGVAVGVGVVVAVAVGAEVTVKIEIPTEALWIGLLLVLPSEIVAAVFLYNMAVLAVQFLGSPG